MKCSTFTLVLLFCTTLLAAQSPSVYSISSNFENINAEQEPYNDLYSYTEVLVDPSGEWTYAEVLTKKNEFDENTTRSEEELRKVYWVKLQIQSTESGPHLFSVGKLYDDHNLVDLYYTHGDSLVHQRSGYMVQPSEKAIRRSGSYFWVELREGKTQDLYFRVDNLYKDCYCYSKNPVSIFHIDSMSVKYGQEAYVLRDFEEVQSTDDNNGPRKFDLIRYFEFYPDPTCNLELDEVRQNWNQHSYFRGYKVRDFPLDTCHWVRLRVVNPKSESQTRTFAYSLNRWDQIEYHVPDQKGQYQKYQAFPDANDQKAFSFSIAPLDTLELYIRYPTRNGSYAFNGEMEDIHPDDLQERQERAEYKYLFVGMIVFFLIYFFLQLLFNRDKLLLYYLLALIGLTPFFLISLDHTALFIYTRSVYTLSGSFHEYAINLARLLAVFGLMKFTQVALDLKREMPRYHKIVNWAIGITLILCLNSMIIWTLEWTGRLNTPKCLYCASLDVTGVYSGLLAGLLLFISIKAYLKKIRLSGNFLIALMPVVLVIFWLSFLRFFLFSDYEIFGPFVVGLWLTLMLFGIFVGARINRMQLEKVESEKQKIQLSNQLLQIEFKALRAQMNPHFIFNCLNSIKSLIQESANKQAIHYLTQFSKFIRNVLQYSEEKRITLEEELNISSLYLEMEKLRFEKSFNYKISVAQDVDTSFIKVPPMVLQPFLENAIWHGLMHKNGDRMLHLEIIRNGEAVKCIVEDNGIGRKKAAILQANTRAQHRSFGTKLILDRLRINNELFDSNFVIDIVDKIVQGEATGTRVELSLFI